MPFLLMMSVLIGCGGSVEQVEVVPAPVPALWTEPVAKPAPVQVIRPDLEHRYVRGEGQSYEISTAESLSLDLSGMIHESALGDPTAVHVFFGRGRLYRFEHPGLAVLELSAATAQPLAGSEPWPGFPPLSRATLSIGVESEPGALDGFSPLWTSEVEVK